MHSFIPSGEASLRISLCPESRLSPCLLFPLVLLTQPLPTWGFPDFVSPHAGIPCLLIFFCRLPACPLGAQLLLGVLSARVSGASPHPETPCSWPLQGGPLLTPSHACLISSAPLAFSS